MFWLCKVCKWFVLVFMKFVSRLFCLREIYLLFSAQRVAECTLYYSLSKVKNQHNWPTQPLTGECETSPYPYTIEAAQSFAGSLLGQCMPRVMSLSVDLKVHIKTRTISHSLLAVRRTCGSRKGAYKTSGSGLLHGTPPWLFSSCWQKLP